MDDQPLHYIKRYCDKIIEVITTSGLINTYLYGESGTGKSYIASAIGYEACKNGVRTLYSNASKLMGQLKMAKNKGTIESEMKSVHCLF